MSANEIYAGARVEPGNALIDITADGVEYVAEALFCFGRNWTNAGHRLV